MKKLFIIYFILAIGLFCCCKSETEEKGEELMGLNTIDLYNFEDGIKSYNVRVANGVIYYISGNTLKVANLNSNLNYNVSLKSLDDDDFVIQYISPLGDRVIISSPSLKRILLLNKDLAVIKECTYMNYDRVLFLDSPDFILFGKSNNGSYEIYYSIDLLDSANLISYTDFMDNYLAYNDGTLYINKNNTFTKVDLSTGNSTAIRSNCYAFKTCSFGIYFEDISDNPHTCYFYSFQKNKHEKLGAVVYNQGSQTGTTICAISPISYPFAFVVTKLTYNLPSSYAYKKYMTKDFSTYIEMPSNADAVDIIGVGFTDSKAGNNVIYCHKCQPSPYKHYIKAITNFQKSTPFESIDLSTYVLSNYYITGYQLYRTSSITSLSPLRYFGKLGYQSLKLVSPSDPLASPLRIKIDEDSFFAKEILGDPNNGIVAVAGRNLNRSTIPAGTYTLSSWQSIMAAIYGTKWNQGNNASYVEKTWSNCNIIQNNKAPFNTSSQRVRLYYYGTGSSALFNYSWINGNYWHELGWYPVASTNDSNLTGIVANAGKICYSPVHSNYASYPITVVSGITITN